MTKAMLILGSSHFGGAERRFARVFNELRNKNYDICLITNNSLLESLENHNILQSRDKILTIDNYGFNNFWSKIKLDRISAAIKIIYLIYKYRITAIHIITCNPIVHSFLSIMPFLLIGVSLFDPRIETEWEWNRTKFTRLVFRRIVKKAIFVDFLSAEIKDEFKKRFIKEKNSLFVSPCSFIDYKNFFPSEKSVDPIKVISLSRLDPMKNVDLFIRAVHRIKESYPASAKKAKFYIYGNGPEKEKLQFLTKELNVAELIEFHYSKLPELVLRDATIFASLQVFNNYPSQSLIEAMACGNAIVATDVGETRKLVNNDRGMLVGNDPDEVARAIAYLIENHEMALKFGKYARRFVMKEHTSERFTTYIRETIYPQFG